MKKQQIAEIEERLLLREILEIKKSTQQSEKRIVESTWSTLQWLEKKTETLPSNNQHCIEKKKGYLITDQRSKLFFKASLKLYVMLKIFLTPTFFLRNSEANIVLTWQYVYQGKQADSFPEHHLCSREIRSADNESP